MNGRSAIVALVVIAGVVVVSGVLIGKAAASMAQTMKPPANPYGD